ncbi:hypothetical protein AOLI_G00200730 [Acnodon oligacanthus]
MRGFSPKDVGLTEPSACPPASILEPSDTAAREHCDTPAFDIRLSPEEPESFLCKPHAGHRKPISRPRPNVLLKTIPRQSTSAFPRISPRAAHLDSSASPGNSQRGQNSHRQVKNPSPSGQNPASGGETGLNPQIRVGQVAVAERAPLWPECARLNGGRARAAKTPAEGRGHPKTRPRRLLQRSGLASCFGNSMAGHLASQHMQGYLGLVTTDDGRSEWD